MSVLEMPASVVAEGDAGDRLTFGGFDIIFKSPAPDGAAGWTVADYTLPARRPGAPLHYHRELTESFYVLSGRLWMRVGDREIDAGPGSFVLVAPGTLHAFANHTDAPARFLAHASSPRHKEFLCRLFRMAQDEAAWPPRDPSVMARLGAAYDTFYK